MIINKNTDSEKLEKKTTQRNSIKIILYLLLLLLYAKFYYEKPIEIKDLTFRTVKLNKDLTTASGRYAKYGYSFTELESKAKFTIDNCVNFVCDRMKLKQIKTGDIVKIGFDSYLKDALIDEEIEIPIYSLEFNNQIYFTSKDYVKGQEKQNFRRLILFSILGLFLLLTSIEIKKKKLVWGIFILLGLVITVLIERKII